MKILVVGGGGREHALCWKIAQSSLVTELFCSPGNAGTATVAENIILPNQNHTTLALWAVANQIDLAVIGPDNPLAEGIVNIFEEHGIRVFGPIKEAAQLEASKSFAKTIMNRAGIITAKGGSFEDYNKAREFLELIGAPVVIKADGLAFGKGVVVCDDFELAENTLKEFMLDARFGESSKKVVIEEKLVGKEASIIAMVDGSAIIPFVVSSDHKRLLDNDEGPNTGGMGVISPTPVVDGVRIEDIINQVFIPAVEELKKLGITYRGFLYAGLMITPDKVPYVLEFNCRLGDPETQVILPRMKSDIVPILLAATEDRLSTQEIEWSKDEAACVVLASRGYPDKVDDGYEIFGLPEGNQFNQSSIVFHAGTKSDGDRVVSKGGRILCVTGLGENREEALSKAYSTISKINFEGMQYRKDIGRTVDK